mgnify:CR=1 FL=1
MSKIKKVLAIILSMAMILGMSITTFADSENEINITVENLDSKAFIQYEQIIVANPNTETGWDFTEAGKKYAASFKDMEEQEIIKELIAYAKKEDSKITATAIDIALKNVQYSGNHITPVGGTATFKVNTAGVYAIKASTEDSDFVYNPMAVYVGFTYGDGVSLDGDKVVDAKGTSLTTEKEHSNHGDQDYYEAVGKEVEYTVHTTVPYISESVTDVKYTITDTIVGAEYVVEHKDGQSMITATVKLGLNGERKEYQVPVRETEEDGVSGQTFTIDLSSIAADRNNANLPLEIKYKAIVTDLYVANKVVPSDGEHEFKEGTDWLWTAKAVLIKKDADEENRFLNGAEFKLYDPSDETWAICSGDNGVYQITKWTKNKEEATALVTATVEEKDGRISISGLDSQVSYQFIETKAPTGYSKDETAAIVQWSLDDGESTRAIVHPVGVATKTNTKLSSLPSTGGIGTTIFTIGGCVIMIAAAGLYFANRRRQENK